MRDIIVIQSLQSRGYGLDNIEEALQYEAVEHKPRVLDKEPRKVSINKAKEIYPYGCCSEFVMAYNDISKSANLDQATIEIKGVTRVCDVSVYVALKTLIVQGVSYCREKAEAFYNICRIIMTTPGDTLTRNRVFETLNKYEPEGYFEKELIKALGITLFNESLASLYWVSLCEDLGFYKDAIEKGKAVISESCKTEKDVTKFLNPLYKAAKEDQAFMSQVYKPGANKWLVAMLYYLRDKPEYLNPGNAEGGFA